MAMSNTTPFCWRHPGVTLIQYGHAGTTIMFFYCPACRADERR